MGDVSAAGAFIAGVLTGVILALGTLRAVLAQNKKEK